MMQRSAGGLWLPRKSSGLEIVDAIRVVRKMPSWLDLGVPASWILAPTVTTPGILAGGTGTSHDVNVTFGGTEKVLVCRVRYSSAPSGSVLCTIDPAGANVSMADAGTGSTSGATVFGISGGGRHATFVYDISGLGLSGTKVVRATHSTSMTVDIVPHLLFGVSTAGGGVQGCLGYASDGEIVNDNPATLTPASAAGALVLMMINTREDRNAQASGDASTNNLYNDRTSQLGGAVNQQRADWGIDADGSCSTVYDSLSSTTGFFFDAIVYGDAGAGPSGARRLVNPSLINSLVNQGLVSC